MNMLTDLSIIILGTGLLTLGVLMLKQSFATPQNHYRRRSRSLASDLSRANRRIIG